MSDWRSNIETQIFKESYNGIIICGLNWGGTESEDDNYYKQEEKMHFSHSMYNCKFRERLLKWFEIWGYKFETTDENVSSLEKSISYTNWLNTKSKNLNGIDIFSELKNYPDNIINTINALSPRIIIFLSKQLIFALNEPTILNQLKDTLGKNKSLEEVSLQKQFTQNYKRFKVYKQEFDNCTIISLPHPSGTRGLKNEYIQLFKEDMSIIFTNYKIINRLNY